jgi:membrane protease YdiL (CAAX protease family)
MHPAATASLSSLELALRTALPVLLAVATTLVFDHLCVRRRILPPGFATAWRRTMANLVIAGVLWIGVFRPLGDIGLEVSFDPSRIATPQLFALQALMAFAILAWGTLGYAGVRPRAAVPVETLPDRPEGELQSPPPVLEAEPPPEPFLRQLASQLGYRSANPLREIGIGLILGIAAWGVVVAALVVVALVIYALHGEAALPKAPPAVVPWLAALPLTIRFAISLSAGVVEETFFRGLLQPRMGIVVSTSMFALAHLSYGQPFMLLGITLLSLIYALLVRWRQTILPSIAAHALFDGIQLLVIIPLALRFIGRADVAVALFP